LAAPEVAEELTGFSRACSDVVMQPERISVDSARASTRENGLAIDGLG
jgi:hypothetical protein